MHFDFADLSWQNRYRLMTATITPRPIAWVSTLNAGGGVNLAPFSFFNMMGHTPATVVLGLMTDAARGLKDTARNIVAQGEFVLSLVPFALAEAMNLTCIDAPHGVDEAALAGLDLLPSARVAPPRVAASPVAFECRLFTALTPSASQTIIIGEVLAAEVLDSAVTDPARCHIDNAALDLFGRMSGRGIYARTRDRFQLERPVWTGKPPEDPGAGD